MCGIAGYFGKGNKEVLFHMAEAIKYRGPDDVGFFEDRSVGLAHRRLSIMDLSAAGHQPMSNDDETVWIVFNGEIYNFKELRRELENEFKFKSRTDTEVIIRLYERFGVDAFSKIEGMFSIALYDKRIHTLFLARDRMGKKPLYYATFGETFLFGSEIKALMAHPSFKREIDLKSLNKYLQYEYVPTPHSMFAGVSKLEPGHYLSYDGVKIERQKFWDVSFSKRDISLESAVAELGKHLADAVKDRLMADVPLGIFLSGGLDSSTIAYYAQKGNAAKIQTFSIGFTEKSFDESEYARRVAQHLGTDHHEQIFSSKDAVALVPTIGKLLDEPMADASILPTYLLSRFTSEHVKVALGGDGGDELFFGYDTFTAHKLAAWYEKIPSGVRRHLIEPSLMRLPVSLRNMSLDFKAKKFISGFYGEEKYRNQRWLGSFNTEERLSLFAPALHETSSSWNEFEDIDCYLRDLPEGIAPEDALTYLYLRMYMMDDILVKVDRASMYNSLEVRAPFLDTRVVNFATSIKTDFKMHGFTTKFILKKLMEDKLPHDIVYRKKKGFGIPLAEWLKGDLKPLVLDLLSPERLKRQSLFDSSATEVLLREHFEGAADHRKQIWTLLIFQLWYDNWYI